VSLLIRARNSFPFATVFVTSVYTGSGPDTTPIVLLPRTFSNDFRMPPARPDVTCRHLRRPRYWTYCRPSREGGGLTCLEPDASKAPRYSSAKVDYGLIFEK